MDRIFDSGEGIAPEYRMVATVALSELQWLMEKSANVDRVK
jgi:hypothetical protein